MDRSADPARARYARLHRTHFQGTHLVEGVGHEHRHAVLRGGGLHARGQVHVRGEVGGVNLWVLVMKGRRPDEGKKGSG